MIKIIRDGTRRQVNCPQCGCLFSYEQEDIQNNITDYKFSSDTSSVSIINLKEFYLKCPQCYYKIVLSKEKELK